MEGGLYLGELFLKFCFEDAFFTKPGVEFLRILVTNSLECNLEEDFLEWIRVGDKLF